MLDRLSRAGLIWPSLLSLVGLAILIGLGNWQMSRKAEKETVIAQIEKRRTGEPVQLESVLRDYKASQADYQRVTVSGTFIENAARFYYAPDKRLGPGFDVYQPLQYAPGKVVWVNRGYIPKRLRDEPASWQAKGVQTVIGHARLPAVPGSFTPPNDVANNVWYWRDLKGMQEAAFSKDEATNIEAAPFFVVEERQASDQSADDWPRPGVSEFEIFNKHLEYALTWYGLAATLLAVFGAFAWGRLSKTG